jgi:hypothetical protein
VATKNTNRITKRKTHPKDVDYVGYLRPEGALRNNPTSKAWRETLAEKILEFGMKDDTLEIMEFCFQNRILWKTLSDWRKKYPELQDAWDEAKLMIAARRRKGTIKKEYSGEYAYRDLHLYDPEWKEVNKYHAALKNQDFNLGNVLQYFAQKPEVTGKEELAKQVGEVHE